MSIATKANNQNASSNLIRVDKLVLFSNWYWIYLYRNSHHDEKWARSVLSKHICIQKERPRWSVIKIKTNTNESQNNFARHSINIDIFYIDFTLFFGHFFFHAVHSHNKKRRRKYTQDICWRVNKLCKFAYYRDFFSVPINILEFYLQLQRHRSISCKWIQHQNWIELYEMGHADGNAMNSSLKNWKWIRNIARRKIIFFNDRGSEEFKVHKMKYTIRYTRFVCAVTKIAF